MTRKGVELRAWWKSRGHSCTLDRALEERADAARLRAQCLVLVRLLVRHGLYRKTMLQDSLPGVLRLCPPRQARAVFNHLIAVASKGRDPFAGGLLEAVLLTENLDEAELLHTLTVIAECPLDRPLQFVSAADAKLIASSVPSLPPAVFRAGLQLAAGVSAQSGRSVAVFTTVLPALCRAYQVEQELLSRVQLLSHMVMRETARASLCQALEEAAILPPDRFASVFEAAIDVSSAGHDSRPLGRWAARASPRLGSADFRRALEVAVRLTSGASYCVDALEGAIPQEGAPSAAGDFQALLETVEALTGAGRKRNPTSTIISALGRASSVLTAEKLRAVLDLTERMLDADMDPAGVLSETTALARLDDRQFVAAIDLGARMVAAGLAPGLALRQGIPAVAQSCEWSDYVESIDAALRLVERKVDPTPLLQFGAPVANMMEDKAAARRVVEQHLVRAANWSSTWSSCRHHGVQAVLEFRPSLDLEFALQVFECLVDRIQKSHGDPGTSPGLAQLARQAMALASDYEDFTVSYRPAITHQEEQSDSYFGSSSSTVVDEPARLELAPAGERRVPIAIALRSSDEVETLLAERSWLWRHLATAHARERALDRAAGVRAQLGTIVDGMIRSRILESGHALAAAYLIGSYPWVDRPADIDMFFVVEGRRDVTRVVGAGLAATGFNAGCLPAPLDIEVAGWETLLDAVRGADGGRAQDLRHRHTLLHGSLLLAGRDLHEHAGVSAAALLRLREHIIENSRRADWPELAGNSPRIEAKREWRRREAEALKCFLGA